MLKISFRDVIEDGDSGSLGQRERGREDDGHQADSWRQGRVASTQKKREESIKKCPDWLKQHPKEEKRRRLLLCVLIASTSSLTASALRNPPSWPGPDWSTGSAGMRLLGDQLEVSE